MILILLNLSIADKRKERKRKKKEEKQKKERKNAILRQELWVMRLRNAFPHKNAEINYWTHCLALLISSQFDF